MGIFSKKSKNEIEETEYSHIKDDYTLFRFIDSKLHPKASFEITSTREREPNKGGQKEKHEYRAVIKTGDYLDGTELKKRDANPAVIAEWVMSVKDFITESLEND